MYRQERGRRFERQTADWLQEQGMEIVGRNLRFRVGEVDLFVHDRRRSRFIVIEVRGRTSSRFRPSLMISPHKIRRLKTMAKILQLTVKESVHIELVEVIEDSGKTVVRSFPIF